MGRTMATATATPTAASATGGRTARPVMSGPTSLMSSRLPDRSLPRRSRGTSIVFRLAIGGSSSMAVDARRQRVLGGLVPEVLLAPLGEQELEELLGLLRLVGVLEDADAGHVDEGALTVGALARVEVGHRGVGPLLELAVEVVVVDEADVDLAAGDRRRG